MTGSELAEALRAVAKSVKGLPCVRGLSLEIAPGVWLRAGSLEAERAKRYRARKRELERNTERDDRHAPTVTMTVTDDRDGVTSGSPHTPLPLPDNSSGSSLFPDPESSVLSSSDQDLKESARVKAPKRRWTRVPADWEPNEKHRQIARELGVDFELQLENFRDHEFAKPKLDADATFRKWLRDPKSRPPLTAWRPPPGRVEHERTQADERTRRPTAPDPGPLKPLGAMLPHVEAAMAKLKAGAG